MIAEHEKSALAARYQFEELERYVSEAANSGEAMHVVEEGLWDRLLLIGRLSLDSFVKRQGNGDVGKTLTLPDGQTVPRLEESRTRRYVSVFGELKFESTTYGIRETQKIEAAPLDARLQLPDSDYSYVLQDWDQSFCVQNPFGQSGKLVEKILRLDQPVETLEHMNRSMGDAVDAFRESQPPPPPAQEGSLMVLAADCKGVPMRRDKDDPVPADPKHPTEEERKNKKRMACVGAAYTIEPFVRTVDDVINEVLREKARSRRPKPQHKRLRADLTYELDGKEVNAKDVVFDWLEEEAVTRNPGGLRPEIGLTDGEHALQNRMEKRFPNLVLILEIYHPLGKLRDAAHCFFAQRSDEAEQFVEGKLRMLLEGKVGYVIRTLRQMAKKHRLRGKKKETIREVTQYYHNNRHRMKYDEYLAAGYPIGSGVVEGACRHLVKDRMEGTGMHWRHEGAQPMLKTRATYLNDEWDPFCKFRIETETNRLYPYREILEQFRWN